MGRASGVIGRWGVVTSLLLLIATLPARADVTTDRGSSILIFPKLLFDSQGILPNGRPVDTIIQISNKSNQLVFAHCFYINTVPADPTRPASATNPSQWTEVDFGLLVLTKQQPTYWQISSGRRIEPDPLCSRTVRDCNNAGFDPGAVPPVNSDPFVGELRCIETDSTGAPLNGNHLKGEATIVTKDDNDASKYNAIGVIGLNTDTGPNNGDNTLCLGGGTSEQCPTGAEYNACPQTLILTHYAECNDDPSRSCAATDPVIEEIGSGPSQVVTELTLVPCSEDYEQQAPQSVTVQFAITNEFEQSFSTSTTVTCWGNFRLNTIGPVGRIFEISTLGSRFAQTRIFAPGTDASGGARGGLVGVVEEFHRAPRTSPTPSVGRAAFNLFVEGQRPNADLIVMPEQ